MSDRFSHDLVCNGSRNHPIGASGHGCSCLGRLQRDRDRLSAVESERDTLAKRVEDSEDEARVLRDELSHIADALGVAPYGGCYERAEVLERAKVLAKRVEELEKLVVRRHDAKTIGDMGQLDVDLYAEAQAIATRRAGRAS